MNSTTYQPASLAESMKARILETITVGSTHYFITRFGLGYAVIRKRGHSAENLFDSFSQDACFEVMDEFVQEERETWGHAI